MESQESDLCEAGDYEMIMGEPGMDTLISGIQWHEVAVPELNPIIANPTGELPARNDFVGQHLFDAKVDMSGNQKKHYYVSSKLNKVFVDLGKVVPIQIKWDGTPSLFVRALMVFTEADQMKVPVKRCVTHRQPDNPTNDRYPHCDHVLAMENDGAVYAVDPVSHRHSVRVSLNLQQGCDYSIISLKFMCKTSCTGGLNRAPTEVIFTLEDVHGTVLGRQVIGVKICSCPKRDKEKDEQNLSVAETSSGKRKMKVKREEKAAGAAEEPALKKIKQEFPLDTANTQFMVNCSSPQVAHMVKEYLHHLQAVKMVELCPAGLTPTPLFEIVDQIAVVHQPYN